MVAAVAFPPHDLPVSGDQRVLLHGVPWQTYVMLRDAVDAPGLRMTYDQGTLELMSPSTTHEVAKKVIARMVELFAPERDIPLYAYGSTTFRSEAEQRGLEPDECYCVGRPLDEAPDIALEVVVTSGGLDKLPIYGALGVREVWFWERGAFHLHGLREGGYERIPASELVPDLDVEVLARFASRTDQHEAIKAYRDWLRAAR